MKATNYQTSLSNWQIELAQVITDPHALLSHLELNPAFYEKMLFAHKDFPLRVTRSYLNRIKKNDPNDPLLLQILPQAVELEKFPGYSCDPLQENKANAIPGLLHKYKDRVLFIVTGACAIHCRYCFRRHFPYEGNRTGWDEALAYLYQHSEVKEVILSGGDPLTAKDHYLLKLLERLSAVPHLKRLRIHTRMPIVLPSRITSELLSVITATRLKPVLVMHCNHANEIDEAVTKAFKKLSDANIVLLNQTVLLKNINDSIEALINLSESLFASGVIPYYLHLLDKVQGAAHFSVSEKKARELIWKMMQELSGYLVPKLVREVSGAPAKIPIRIY